MGDLDEANHRLLRAAGRALAAVGDDLHGRAINRVPLREGTLRGSGEVAFLAGGQRHLSMRDAVEAALHAGDGATLEVEVSFNTPYAAAQHEGAPGPPRSWAGHSTLTYSQPGTGPKYLEGPLLEEAARYENVLARTIALEMNR